MGGKYLGYCCNHTQWKVNGGVWSVVASGHSWNRRRSGSCRRKPLAVAAEKEYRAQCPMRAPAEENPTCAKSWSGASQALCYILEVKCVSM